MNFLPDEFQAFLEKDCNRCQFIMQRLSEAGVKSTIVSIGESKHILVQFNRTAYNPMFKIKTVLVHYDRVANSPGANDNSAAVFQIMDWAIRLSKYQGVHNIRIFFTDGEEIGSVTEQGAFGIATKFRNLGILNDDVYVFDCCGRGDVPILSKAGSNSGDIVFRKKFNSLIERTKKLLRDVSPQKWLSLPMPYSDNAGFIACGIPAVAITILPEQEATLFLRQLQKHKDLETAVIKNASTQQSDYEVTEKLPITWRMLHTEQDNCASLTPEAFKLMNQLLDSLAELKSIP